MYQYLCNDEDTTQIQGMCVEMLLQLYKPYYLAITLLKILINQARGLRSHVPGSLKLLWFAHLCVCVYVCLCLCVCPLRALITSGVIWCDIGRVRLVKQVSQFFPVAVDKCLPKKTKVTRYWLQKDYWKDRVLHL